MACHNMVWYRKKTSKINSIKWKTHTFFTQHDYYSCENFDCYVHPQIKAKKMNENRMWGWFFIVEWKEEGGLNEIE